MNKKELINQLHDKTDGITKKRLEDLHDVMFGIIAKALSRAESVTIGGGFGTFAASSPDVRDARTGEPIRIPARKAVKFKAGKRLKEAVNH